MIRVAIVTSSRAGTASQCLPELAEAEDITVGGVILVLGHYRTRWRKLRSKAKKVGRIGIGGAIVGRGMRRWHRDTSADDIAELSKRLGIPFYTSPRTNAPETRELLRQTGAELGLSLGNSWLAPSVFSIPALGMINVHGEVLPRYRGAATAIWAIHDGNWETGFTIHQLERHIDAGAILYQEQFPIVVRSSLRATVVAASAETSRRVPLAVRSVVSNYHQLRAQAIVQEGGSDYTTPTLRQFLRMRRQHQDRVTEVRRGQTS